MDVQNQQGMYVRAAAVAKAAETSLSAIAPFQRSARLLRPVVVVGKQQSTAPSDSTVWEAIKEAITFTS
jgi:hypothetical protein